MIIVNLLLSFQNTQDLDTFADLFLRAIGAEEVSIRESANYPEGRYYKGKSRGMTIGVSLSDEPSHEDLPFWVVIEGPSSSEGGFQATLDQIIKSEILPHGFRVARMENFGKRNEQRINY